MPSRATSSRSYRIGIDVGGTFTKAVLIDNATREVVGRLLRADHARPCQRRRQGRGRGIPQGAGDSGVAPESVVFLAHSTTQATNALLEGDVAPVGVHRAWPSERAAAAGGEAGAA